jgi:hypothetical protein
MIETSSAGSKLASKQSYRNINSKSSARPKIDKLQTVADSYLKPLPSKKRTQQMNKTTATGFR